MCDFYTHQTLSAWDSNEAVSAFEHDPNGRCPLSHVSKAKNKDMKLSLPLVRIYCCYRRLVDGAALSVQCTYPVYIRNPTWVASPPFICRRCFYNLEYFSLVPLTHHYTLPALVPILCAQTTSFGIVQCGFGIIAFSDTGMLLSRYLTSIRYPRHAAYFRLTASPSTDP